MSRLLGADATVSPTTSSWASRRAEFVVDPAMGDRLDALIRNFSQMLEAEVALLCQVDRRGRLQTISSWGIDGNVEVGTNTGALYRGRNAGGFVGRALAHGRLAFETLDAAGDSALVNATRGRALTHAAAAPVPLPGEARYELVAGFATAPASRLPILSFAESYAALIALCLQHPTMLDGLLEGAREDGLTGCLTYDNTLHELTREINRSERSATPLSVCFIDLDGFKRVNDNHGHLRGNRVLAEVAQFLRNGVRSCDTVGRYGGDEFIAILPETTASEAGELAERLSARLSAAKISGIEDPLTASIGLAEWMPSTTAVQLLRQADEALLIAKAHGAGIVSYGAATDKKHDPDGVGVIGAARRLLREVDVRPTQEKRFNE